MSEIQVLWRIELRDSETTHFGTTSVLGDVRTICGQRFTQYQVARLDRKADASVTCKLCEARSVHALRGAVEGSNLSPVA